MLTQHVNAYNVNKIIIEHVTIFLWKYISKDAVDNEIFTRCW